MNDHKWTGAPRRATVLMWNIIGAIVVIALCIEFAIATMSPS